ncbi:M23 family metallopeptidase [Streptomyces liangshanensis]|uniref:Peptidoglycan DD-metalloendopeptidase family protein n=1 Tax=Streptomyces liangshanensis TaxID=2717324 RepID=A0A6G9GXT3_9ACTN|nr:peptidoglycan DD-metalloendopeptidase family protein [Streptomyces liangshanensis]QIQ03093.1 peptidoglycan DD-metalloendopeptidase family protein [Streptomyces liangshanensis]
MNDQHTNAGYTTHDGYQNGSFQTDPLFGNLSGGYETPQATGEYTSTPWDSGAHQTVGTAGVGTVTYDAYAAPQYDTTGQWDADAWNQANPLTQQDPPNGADTAGQFATGTFGYDAQGHPPTAQFDVSALQAGQPYGYDATAQWVAPTYETGAYDATAWNGQETPYQQDGTPYPQDGTAYQAGEHYPPEAAYQDGTPYQQAEEHYQPGAGYETDAGYGHDTPAPYHADGQYAEDGPYAEDAHTDPADEDFHDHAGDAGDGDPLAESVPAAHGVHMEETMTAPAIVLTPRPVGRSAGGNGSRGRRRTPAKRSALLTIAVPSACVMGVAGIAAASVGDLAGEDKPDNTVSTQAADVSSAKKIAAANAQVDSQVMAMSADARDFGDRASRTQERIDLQARKEAEKQKRLADAARKEALRPKFALPVAQHGLSAFFGQAGVNWMSVHTGIDFPVSYGTPVMAATDGTVRTQYNTAYGNMAIVTSPDGTETWYCHLSSTKFRSGSVKAGDVIAYSGNSGNSTGPHLHFEVRPGGGAAINPLPWLQSHGLNPQ